MDLTQREVFPELRFRDTSPLNFRFQILDFRFRPHKGKPLSILDFRFLPLQASKPEAGENFYLLSFNFYLSSLRCGLEHSQPLPGNHDLVASTIHHGRRNVISITSVNHQVNQATVFLVNQLRISDILHLSLIRFHGSRQ